MQEARAIVSGRNIFKNLTNGDTHPRKKHLVDLETDISSATKCAAIIFEMRPYFLRTRRMDENPYILQLQNATVDLKTNTIRHTSPTDYASKQSSIRVPDYALPGSTNLREPPTAEQDRRWVIDFIWSVFRADASLKPHDLDAHGTLGPQGKTNSYFSLFLFARLLEGVPLKRAVFFFPPRGEIRRNHWGNLFDTSWGRIARFAKTRSSRAISNRKSQIVAFPLAGNQPVASLGRSWTWAPSGVTPCSKGGQTAEGRAGRGSIRT